MRQDVNLIEIGVVLMIPGALAGAAIGWQHGMLWCLIGLPAGAVASFTAWMLTLVVGFGGLHLARSGWRRLSGGGPVPGPPDPIALAERAEDERIRAGFASVGQQVDAGGPTRHRLRGAEVARYRSRDPLPRDLAVEHVRTLQGLLSSCTIYATSRASGTGHDIVVVPALISTAQVAELERLGSGTTGAAVDGVVAGLTRLDRMAVVRPWFCDAADLRLDVVGELTAPEARAMLALAATCSTPVVADADGADASAAVLRDRQLHLRVP